jgi:photosystem II stability/assembly factor-like uncharacterized protein
VKALARTVDGVFAVDVETEDVERNGELNIPEEPSLSLPRVVTAAAAGSTYIAVVDRRPPLLVSYDAGTTWHEAGGGLPPGRAVAIAADDPDRVLYAARNRLYVSSDGGRFWRALTVELPEIQAVAWSA